jgi:hypothetical protein
VPTPLQPFDWIGGPKRYDAPDWTEIGTVTRVWVPDDETVGWVVLQGENRLAWLSASDPDSLGYAIRLHVDELTRSGAANGVPVLATWEEILRTTLHSTPEDLYLPAVMADIQRAWMPL